MDDLKECPFCGGAAALQEHEAHSHSGPLKALGIPDHPGSFTIECIGSPDCNTGQIGDTRAEVVAMWNRRAVPQANAEQDAELGEVDVSTKQGKLLALADRIDHEQLWRMAGMDHHKLTDEQKDRMTAAVALRRYADIWTPGHWVVVPPTGSIQFGASTLDEAVKMAERHAIRAASKTTPSSGEGSNG